MAYYANLYLSWKVVTQTHFNTTSVFHQLLLSVYRLRAVSVGVCLRVWRVRARAFVRVCVCECECVKEREYKCVCVCVCVCVDIDTLPPDLLSSWDCSVQGPAKLPGQLSLSSRPEESSSA